MLEVSRCKTYVNGGVVARATRLLFALLYLLCSHTLAFATPSDIGHLIRSKKLEDTVLIPHQIETSLTELNTQPKEVNLQSILEPYANNRDQVRAVLNLLSNPSALTVSVRLLNGSFFDDKVARDYQDRLANFAFTGYEREGYKFFQQIGYAPIREELWRELRENGGEDGDRIFAEARAGGEVVLLDSSGKLYRLSNEFTPFHLPERDGLDGVALLGDGVYGNITSPGQTIATAFSSTNTSLFELSEAIPTIYAFSLRRLGEESSGTTLQYYVSIGISSEGGAVGELLYEQAAIIPISVRVEQRSEEVCDNGSDDDGDGSPDCSDSDCSSSPACPTPPPTEDCYNGTDDDSDGSADCSDADCSYLQGCSPPSETCDNGYDDDGDGYADCSDTDCNWSPNCITPPEDCTNGVDDDRDWWSDCSDSDCQNTSVCTACSAECPNGGGSCSCSNSWWSGCSCDCSSCPQQPQNPEFLSISESQSYPLGCFSDDFSFQVRLPQYGDYVLYDNGQHVRNLGWTSGDQSISLPLSPGYHQLTLFNQSGGGSASVGISTYYSCEPENCSDGYDNNGNGYVDCTDPECSSYWTCYPQSENCGDGFDNDYDGATDCSDYDCSTTYPCYMPSEDCSDGWDNDGDGAVDCNDSDCPGCIVYYEQCDNNSDDDYDGSVDCSDPDCSSDYRCHTPQEYPCNDGWDNDYDWMTDCSDPDCSYDPACTWMPENCGDTVDNDGDGFIDCEDTECSCADIEICSREGDEDGDGYADCFDKDCARFPACAGVPHEICDDAVDNDENGTTDCDDYWCQGESLCVPQEICDNGTDDDGDGPADCQDSDCAEADPCVEKVEDCTNGEDDDGDGQIDGDDPSCRGSEVIPAEGTPLASLDPIFGIRIPEGSTQLASISESMWRLETVTEDAQPLVLNSILVQIRDGVVEAFFSIEERGVFREYLTPNTRYRLTVSLRGTDTNGAEVIVADNHQEFFTTPDTAVLPDGVVLVRHDLVLGSRAIPTPEPTATSTPVPPTYESVCNDGADDDGDGLTDCGDPDCSGASNCVVCVATGSESCGNGTDDDCDGSTDCGDSDCSAAVECYGDTSGGTTGGTTGGPTGGGSGTPTPSLNIPLVKNIIERGTVGITCGERSFEAEIALAPGGMSDNLTLLLYEESYKGVKDPKTGAVVGMLEYRQIQSETYDTVPVLPVVLKFPNGSGKYRIELVNYLGGKSYQTIVNFEAKEGCQAEPTPTEEPDNATATPTPDPTDTPDPPTPTPTQKNDDEPTHGECGNGVKDGDEQCDPQESNPSCGEGMFCDGECNCSSPETAPKCFVCVYGEDNEGQEGYLKGQCQTLWEKAKKDRGVNKRIFISADGFPEGLDGVQNCHPDLTVELISHGSPGEEDAFVSAWEDVVDVAPQCTMGDMEIKVNNCSNFAVSGGVLRNAKEVAKKYAQRGYTGTLKVTGNQYVTLYYARMSLKVRDGLGSMWQGIRIEDPNTYEEKRSVVGEVIALPFRIYGTATLPYHVVRKKIHEARDPGAASQNSWLQLNICSEGVESVLPPCKKAGDRVKVDFDGGEVMGVSRAALTTVACSLDGKRANQDCKEVEPDERGRNCELLEPVLCTN